MCGTSLRKRRRNRSPGIFLIRIAITDSSGIVPALLNWGMTR